MFAWSYQDLKTFDISIMQHKIPLKGDAKPHKQKLRKINPLLLPSIEKEIKKLLKAKIIVPLRYSKWVEAIPMRNAIDTVIIKFMEENIISRFGCPARIVTDNAQAFKSTKFVSFCQQY